MSMISHGWARTQSGMLWPWDLDAAGLSDDDIAAIAKIIRSKFSFSRVFGVTNGDRRLAQALYDYAEADGDHAILLVGGVLSTGKGFVCEGARLARIWGKRPIGVVIFARGPCPNWVWPIMTVNEWAQSRGTGLG